MRRLTCAKRARLVHKALRRNVLRCNLMRCAATCCTALQRAELRCNVLRCVATCRAALQCGALRCNVVCWYPPRPRSSGTSAAWSRDSSTSTCRSAGCSGAAPVAARMQRAVRSRVCTSTGERARRSLRAGGRTLRARRTDSACGRTVPACGRTDLRLDLSDVIRVLPCHIEPIRRSGYPAGHAAATQRAKLRLPNGPRCAAPFPTYGRQASLCIARSGITRVR